MTENTPEESGKTTNRETITFEGAGYYVELPHGMPDLLFPEDEFEMAFEMATGRSISEGTDAHEGELRIHSITFPEPTEVPIANV